MVYSWSSGLDFEIRAGRRDVCIPLVSSEWVQETTLINRQDCTGSSTDPPFSLSHSLPTQIDLEGPGGIELTVQAVVLELALYIPQFSICQFMKD